MIEEISIVYEGSLPLGTIYFDYQNIRYWILILKNDKKIWQLMDKVEIGNDYD